MKRFAISLFLIFVCVFSVWSINYTIDSYDVVVRVGKNAVHTIDEDIVMNFNTAGHGFYREIPYLFNGSPVVAKIRNVSCNTHFEGEYSNGYYVMKIGDENKQVRGKQGYSISYDYDLGADVNEGYDELYLDLLGTDWDCGVSSFTFEVDIPKTGLKASDIFYAATTGFYGASKQVAISVKEKSDCYALVGSVSNLRAGQGVTIRVELPEGWYVGAREPWDLTRSISGVAVYLCIVLLIIAYILWALYGKDKKPIITAQFNPPEDFSPMVVGFLADGSVDDKDVISMIFNWADRGLLTINEKKKNKFSFTKLAEIEVSAPKFEHDLFNAFFKGCAIGDELTLSNIQNNNFAEAMLKAKVSVSKFFTKDRSLHSKKARGLAVLTGFASPIPMLLFAGAFFLTEYSLEIFMPFALFSFGYAGLNILIQWALFRKWYLRKSNIFPCIASSFLCIAACIFTFLASGDLLLSLICCITSFIISIFAVITGKRSDYGQKSLEGVLGYREFIDKVSMDELKLMIDKDPELYYRVLSYAVVLGLEGTWAKKFEGIAVPTPTWYRGYDVFDVMYFSHMASRMRTVIAANSVAQSSGNKVGGGGFHSTGFVGGGFGGGGGHAW